MRSVSFLLLSSAQAAKVATIIKRFRFKDDFFLKINPLETAIAPVNAPELLLALESYGETFRDRWVEALEDDLEDGPCAVENMTIPEFSVAAWRYPEVYDVDELPTPGQSYIDPNTFVQRLYYDIESLRVYCEDVEEDYFTYRDLDKDTYTEAAFAGDEFLEIINPPNTGCDGNKVTCLFSKAESVEYDVFNETNSDLFIQRFTNVPMYLKCLDLPGYGTDVANVLIEAMDEFFEAHVEPELESVIMEQVPTGFVYNFASPYNNGREFFTHGIYYTGGNLVHQVPDDDGILITEYKYGFDVVWFWPHGATDNIIPDVPSVVNEVFDDGAFLNFLQQEYSQYDYVSDATFCEGVDSIPDIPTNPMSPTSSPTQKPTVMLGIGEGPCSSDFECLTGLVCHEDSSTCTCNLNTNFGCESGNVCNDFDGTPKCYCDMFNDGGENGCGPGQFCRFSCAYLVDNPRCFDDPFIRDCTNAWGDGFTCADSNNDGVIDQNDKSGGCDYNAPTSSPTRSNNIPPPPTISPTFPPTLPPTDRPTELPTSQPTAAPTMSPTTLSPTISLEPTEIIHPSSSPSLSPSPTFHPTVSPTYDPTDSPTDLPTRKPSVSPVPDPTQAPIAGPTPPQPTQSPVVPQPAITEPPTTSAPTIITLTPTRYPTASPTDPIPCDDSIPCANGSCCVDGICQNCITDPGNGTKPIIGTCGNGDRGDGICPYEGYCCSAWGWCGTTPEYCSSPSNSPTPFGDGGFTPPTPSLDAGKCGNGEEGEGLCADETHCCSPWGYCGPGENYCFTVDDGNYTDDGTCGAGGIGDGTCRDGNCCSIHGFCGEGPLYCTGLNEQGGVTDDEKETLARSPLPDDLVPKFGFRCGLTEVDARSNCKPECNHHTQCGPGEQCWGVQLNYCHTFKEGTHPICTNLTMAGQENRCGFDETDARGHCGAKCTSSSDCGTGESCFATMLNLCDCFESMDINGEISSTFDDASSTIKPFFLGALQSPEEDDNIATLGGRVEGKPRNDAPAKCTMTIPLLVSLLAILALQ